jgi:hypothetical protein
MLTLGNETASCVLYRIDAAGEGICLELPRRKVDVSPLTVPVIHHRPTPAVTGIREVEDVL